MAKIEIAQKYLKILVSHFLSTPVFKPEMVAVVISADCNLRCKMCNFWRNPKEKQNILEFKDYERLFLQLKGYGVKTVQFTGGEPLLRSDFFEILKCAKKIGLKATVITNATLINEKNAKQLSEYADKIYVSLDAPVSQLHDNLRGVGGTFDKVKNGLALLKRSRLNGPNHGPKVIITAIITPHNIHDPQDMVSLAKSLDVDGIIYNPASSVKGYTDLNNNFNAGDFPFENYDKMIDSIISLSAVKDSRIKSNPFYLESSKEFLRGNKKYYEFACFSAGFDGAHIDIKGDVHPCCAWVYSLGNITEKSFKEIWESNEAKKMRKTIKSRQCPMCYHHTRTFDYIVRAPKMYYKDIKRLISWYRQLLRSMS